MPPLMKFEEGHRAAVFTLPTVIFFLRESEKEGSPSSRRNPSERPYGVSQTALTGTPRYAIVYVDTCPHDDYNGQLSVCQEG